MLTILLLFAPTEQYAAYGKKGRPRMARVFQLDAFGEKASSWTRLDDGKKVHEGESRSMQASFACSVLTCSAPLAGLLWDDTKN